MTTPTPLTPDAAPGVRGFAQVMPNTDELVLLHLLICEQRRTLKWIADRLNEIPTVQPRLWRWDYYDFLKPARRLEARNLVTLTYRGSSRAGGGSMNVVEWIGAAE